MRKVSILALGRCKGDETVSAFQDRKPMSLVVKTRMNNWSTKPPYMARE